MIIIDTDICIELLRGNNKVIERKRNTNDIVAVSFMSVAELYYGVQKSNQPIKNSTLVDVFLLSVEVIQSEPEILKKFGELKVNLQKTGRSLPDADIFIAATALEKYAKLITGNTDHFARIPELIIENWIG